MKHCLILRDQRAAFDQELQEVARLMYGDDVLTMGVGGDPTDETTLGFDALVEWEGGPLPSYDGANWAAGIAALHKVYAFDAILVPATPWGRSLAPRVAMRLRTGLVADVTALEWVEGELEMVRPAYSGKLLAGIVAQGDGPVMMSLREKAFPSYRGPAKTTVRLVFPFRAAPCPIALLATRAKPTVRDIRDSEILVSGGGGVLERFSRLEELASALGAQVSASRRLVDDGVAPRAIQVGQSGKTVSPRLYLALGIDGSTQHLEGLKNVEHLIAVNINKDAPLCSLADVVVEGDAIEFVDRFLERLNKHAIPGG